VAGRGHAGKPHLAAPRRPGTHWRAPPRRSGGLTACRSLARWMIPGLAPFRLPRITPGLQASGRQPAIQETSLSSCSIGASRPGLPAHPCAVTHHQPYREGRRTACGMHDGRGYQRHGNPGRPCRRHVSKFDCAHQCPVCWPGGQDSQALNSLIGGDRVNLSTVKFMATDATRSGTKMRHANRHSRMAAAISSSLLPG
jgi:hypothetical protein